MVLPLKNIPVCLILILFSGNVFAQFDSALNIPRNPGGFFQVSESAKDLTKLERIGYVCGATLAFSLFDYVGFNLIKKNPNAIPPYHVAQGIVQAALTYFLYKECGLTSAISFSLIWWSWGDDIAYYGWSNVIRRPNYQLGGVTWAWWTPIGLTRKKSSVIDNGTLLAQGMLGFWISIAIL